MFISTELKSLDSLLNWMELLGADKNWIQSEVCREVLKISFHICYLCCDLIITMQFVFSNIKHFEVFNWGLILCQSQRWTRSIRTQLHKPSIMLLKVQTLLKWNSTIFWLRLDIVCRVRRARDILIYVEMTGTRARNKELKEIWETLIIETAGISTVMKDTLWLTAHTKLSRGNTITNKTQKTYWQINSPEQSPRQFLSSLFTVPKVVLRLSGAWSISSVIHQSSFETGNRPGFDLASFILMRPDTEPSIPNKWD